MISVSRGLPLRIPHSTHRLSAWLAKLTVCPRDRSALTVHPSIIFVLRLLRAALVAVLRAIVVRIAVCFDISVYLRITRVVGALSSRASFVSSLSLSSPAPARSTVRFHAALRVPVPAGSEFSSVSLVAAAFRCHPPCASVLVTELCLIRYVSAARTAASLAGTASPRQEGQFNGVLAAMIRSVNLDPLSLANQPNAQDKPSASSAPPNPEDLVLATSDSTVLAIATASLPTPGFVTLSAEYTATSLKVSASHTRIHAFIPRSLNDASRVVVAAVERHILAASRDARLCFLVETSFQSHLPISRPELAGALDAVASKAAIKPLRFILAPASPLDSVPTPTKQTVTSYSLRSCPPDADCARCKLHDHLAAEANISLDTPLDKLLAFGTELRQKGFTKHSPPTDVFTPPEESTPVDINLIPIDLRKRVQAWADNHATNPPTARPSTRSPLYNYDDHGGVLPRWSTPPTRKVFSRSEPSSLQRLVLYKEMLKEIVYDDADVIDIRDIRASCAVFVVWHPQSGKPRPCAAPHEANELTPPAPVRYGNPKDLFAVPGVSCGCRLDFERGFKHIRLARLFAIHVSFILDGVGIMPKSVFFGLRDGPLIFCSTLEEDMRAAPVPPPPPGARLSPRVAWVDDIIRLGHPPAYVVLVFLCFVEFMEYRNWRFGVEKCFFLPCSPLKFIGTQVDAPAASFFIPPSAAEKLALWATRILQAASTDAGRSVTPAQRQLLESHMGRLAWVSAIGFHSLSFARSLADRSLASNSWSVGARELLIHHASAAPSWSNIAVTVLPPKSVLRLSTDASVAPDFSEVTGSGFAALPGRSPSHFSIALNRSTLDAFRVSEPSSTWAEAAIATVGTFFANQLIRANPDADVDAIDHVIDSKTVASRAGFCSASSHHCSAFYLLIQQTSAPRPHRISWVSRESAVIADSDAGSASASGLWRPVDPVRAVAISFAPDIDLTADMASTTALSYSSPHHPSDPKRLSNLRALSSRLASSSHGFLGLPGLAPLSNRRIFATLVPSYASSIAAISQAALSASGWTAALLVVLSPDIQAALAAWLDAGVSFRAAHTPCSRLHSVLLAPDGRRPVLSFPVRLLLLTRDASVPSRPDELSPPPGWCTSAGPLVFDRVLSAEESFTRWIMSGQCPHPGPPPPDRPDPASALPRGTFASIGLASASRPPSSFQARSSLTSPFLAASLRLPDLSPAPSLPSASRAPPTAAPVPSAAAAGVPPPAPVIPAPLAASHPAPLAAAVAPPPLHAAASAAALGSSRPASEHLPPLPPGLLVPPGAAAAVAPSAASATLAPLPPLPPSASPHGLLSTLPSPAPSPPGHSVASPPLAAGASAPLLASALASASPLPQAAGPAAVPAVTSAAAAAALPAPLPTLPPVAVPPPSPPARHRAVPSRSARVRRQAAATAAPSFWVDRPLRCGQCHRLVLPHEPALLCDNPQCEGWLVCCDPCIPEADRDAPLLCPLHQADKWRSALLVEAGLAMALAHKPGSVGRLLGCLTAWIGSVKSNQPPMPMSQVLAKAPVVVSPEDSLLPEALRRDAAEAERSIWDDRRRSRLRNVAFKLAWLATKLTALDAPFNPALIALGKAYIRHRLSTDRPAGWRKASAEHVAAELSAVARVLEDLEVPIAPYVATRRVLEARGAFVKREHSPRWPIPPYRIFEMADAEPRPMTAKRQLAVDALVWNAFWGVRPMYLWQIGKNHYTPFKGGYLFRWSHQTKVKRGDREAGPDAELRIPQVTAAKHERLSGIWNRMPSTGPAFADVQDEVHALVKQWFGAEVDALPDFTLALAAVRNGVDMAFQVFHVPPDYNDAHLWWARSAPRMRVYYAGLQVGVMFFVTERLHLIRFTPLAPGWFEVISRPPIPCWDEIEQVNDLPPSASPAQTLEVGEFPLAGDSLGPLPCQAPAGLPANHDRPNRRLRPARDMHRS